MSSPGKPKEDPGRHFFIDMAELGPHSSRPKWVGGVCIRCGMRVWGMLAIGMPSCDEYALASMNFDGPMQ